jgi:hypothetical protein
MRPGSLGRGPVALTALETRVWVETQWPELPQQSGDPAIEALAVGQSIDSEFRNGGSGPAHGA